MGCRHHRAEGAVLEKGAGNTQRAHGGRARSKSRRGEAEMKREGGLLVITVSDVGMGY